MKKRFLFAFVDRDKKKVLLGACAKINLDLFTDNEFLHEICTFFLSKYKKEENTKKIKGLSFYKTVKLLFENIIKSEKGISISLSNDYYAKLPKRYNPSLLTAYKLRQVISFLESEGVIDVYKGLNIQGKQNFQTRIIPSAYLLDLLKGTGLTPLQIELDKKFERIVLKSPKEEGKKLIDYKENKHTKSKREFMIEYEQFINKYNFKCQGSSLGRIYFKRVFNNGTFRNGGRFYSSYQSIKSDIRSKEMTCNGENLVELDYAGLHINMLYALEGLELYDGDVYTIKGFEEHRDLFKIALQIVINAKNYRAACSGMNIHLRKSKITKEVITGKILLDLFTIKHREISKYFFTGIGIRLQNYDSQMVNFVLKKSISLDVPILPVHDSFLVPAKDKKRLITLMNQASKKIMKIQFKIEEK